jgi:hypothetical protein
LNHDAIAKVIRGKRYDSFTIDCHKPWQYQSLVNMREIQLGLDLIQLIMKFRGDTPLSSEA